MTVGKFKKTVREWKRTKDPVKMLVPLDSLELLPADKTRKTHAIDRRSFVDGEGYWNVYPIALDRYCVYIVCPHCHEIHVHGNDKGNYEGPRCPHCFSVEAKTYYILSDPTEKG